MFRRPAKLGLALAVAVGVVVSGAGVASAHAAAGQSPGSHARPADHTDGGGDWHIPGPGGIV